APIQAVVGLAGQGLEVVAGVGGQRAAERARRPFGEGLADAGRQRPRLVGAGLWGHQRENVAAEPADPAALPARRLRRADHPAEELVAGRVAEHVVDGLELVDVHHDDRAATAAALHRGELRVRALFEAAAVQAAGEGVGPRRFRQRAVLAVLVL